MRSFHDQIVIVTGGTSGIGRACAVKLAAAGATVAIVGRNPAAIEQTRAAVSAAAPLTRRAASLGLALDVRSKADMEEMAARVTAAFGQIDALVAAAGVGGSAGSARRVPLGVVQLSSAEWDEVIDTNLKGIFLSNRAVLPHMLRRRQGTIVNVSSSRAAKRGLPFASAYCASKRAMLGLTEALAAEAAPLGIRVMAVLPDATDTPLMSGLEHLCPDGLLTTDIVADLILQMIALPRDVVLEHPLLKPIAVAPR